MTAVCAPHRPTWRKWTGLVLVALPLFMMATDFTVLFLAMPSVAADLAPSTSQMLWIMHVGEFVGAGLVITMGRLTGKIGFPSRMRLDRSWPDHAGGAGRLLADGTRLPGHRHLCSGEPRWLSWRNPGCRHRAGRAGAIGMALLGSLTMVVFSRVLRAGAPEEVPAADLDSATEPRAAVAVAEDIGSATGHDLLLAVQEAWSMGTFAAYIAAFVIGVAAVVLVLRGLWHPAAL